MKKFLSLFAIMLLALGLVACEDKNSVEGAGEAFQVLKLEDLKNASSAENPIVVEFWHSFGHNISNELDPLIEEFEEHYAAQGVYIDVKATSTGGGYDGLRSRVNMGIKSNSIPTMVLGYPDHFASYIENNILLPLDEYVNSSDSDVKLENPTDIYENYWKECRMEVNGSQKIVAIPFNKSTEVMYYNASVVDPILHELGYITKTGNTYGNWTQPTWDQVWAVSRVLRSKADAGTLSWVHGGATVKVDSCTYPTYIDSAANFFITTTRQWGGTYTESTGGTSGKVVFFNDQAVAGQEYFLNLANNEKLWNIPNKVNQSYGSYELNNNRAYISIGSTAGVNNNDSAKYELKVAPYPQVGYGENDVKAVIQQGTNAAILTPNSNNKTRLAAWLLIKYLTDTERTATFSMNTGYLPVRASAKESADYQAFMQDVNSPFTGNVAKTVQAADAQQAYMYTDPAFTGSSIVRDKVDTMILAIYCNNKSITAALQTAYDELGRLRITTEKRYNG